MTFFYLLLGHLIGDFVLQTDKMAENKSREWKWNLLHVLVVTLCIYVVTLPSGLLLNLLILFNGMIHFILDYYKIEIRKTLHFSELSGFLSDQLIHVLFLFIISKAAVSGSLNVFDADTIKGLIVLVLVTSFSAVLTQFILAAMFPRTEGKFFENGEKPVGNLTRLYLSVVFYVSLTQSLYFLALLLIAAVSFYFQFRLGWNKWMSRSHLSVKLLLDVMISAACILLMIL